MIDFETYFDSVYTLSKLSTVEYVQDERFECLGVAIFDSEQMEGVWFPRAQDGLRTIDFENTTILAQNAKFDLLILDVHFGTIPKYSVDLVGIANHVHPMYSAKLKDLCTLYGLPPKGDTMRFRGCTRRKRWHKRGGRTKDKDTMVRQPLMSYEQENALGEYAINDAQQQWSLFVRMLPKLSRPAVEIPLNQHTIELFTRPSVRFDRERAERIRRDMKHAMAAPIEAAGHSVPDISGHKSFRRLLTDALGQVGEELPLKPDKNEKMIPAIAQTDASYDKLLTHADDTVRMLMEARVGLQTWRNKISRVTSLIAQAAANGGILRVPLWYHGAHTGRWSGAEEINLQNLGARKHALDAEVRNCLIPPPGYKFVVVDQAAVEARGTAWVAGQHDLLDAFRDGVDVYCRFASILFDAPIRKGRATDPDPVRAFYKLARSCGKVGILGGGYGMGPLKCQSYGDGYGLSLSFSEACKIINTYRSENTAIVDYWKTVQDAFHWTLKTSRPATAGPIRFHAERDQELGFDVVMTLPSGRELRYTNVAEALGDKGLEMTMYSHRRKKWSKIYGGYLTENIVQGMCRDTLAEAILRLEKQGIRVPLHVHDEVVVLAPVDEAETVLDTVLEELSTSPSWAPDLPLGAEGMICDYYQKP
jgi:DNA polymerase I-like protein with 3'-5' exonuclease and polymerase domains